MGCIQHFKLVLHLQRFSLCLLTGAHLSQASNPSPRNREMRALFLLMITIKGLTLRSSRKIFLCHEIGERLEKIIHFKGAEEEFPMTIF